MKRGAGMRLVVHQAVKDARLLKWLLPVWVLLNVALHVLVLVAVRQPPQPHGTNTALSGYFALAALLVAGFTALSVIVLQNDPAVGTTAFWFTRPIRVRALLGGKFLVLVPAVVLLPVLLDMLALGIGGVPLRAMGGPVAEGLVLQVAWLLPVMAIAALTTDLAQFVLGVIVEVIVFVVVALAVPWLRGVRPPPNLFTEQSTPAFVVVLAALSCIVVAFAYLSRNLRRSAFAAATAPVILAVLLVRPVDFRPAPWLRTTSPAAVRPVAVWHVPPTPYQECQVAVSLELSGVPPTHAIEISAYGGALQFADARVYIDRLFVSAPENGEDQAPTALENAVRAASGGVPRHPAGGVRRLYSAFAGFPASTCADHAHDPAILQVGIRLTSAEYRVAATLPPRVGAAYHIEAGRGEVLDVARASDVMSVRIRQIGLEPLRQTGRLRSGLTVRPVLVGPRSDQVMLSVRSEVGVSPFLSMILPVPQHLASTWWTLDFADAEWLRDARLAMVESRRLTPVERTIEIPDVVLSRLPDRPPR